MHLGHLGRKERTMFSKIHHRRPLNIGVIAGDLWMAHDRRGAVNEARALSSANLDNRS